MSSYVKCAPALFHHRSRLSGLKMTYWETMLEGLLLQLGRNFGLVDKDIAGSIGARFRATEYKASEKSHQLFHAIHSFPSIVYATSSICTIT